MGVFEPSVRLPNNALPLFQHGLSCARDVSVITNTVLGTAMVAGAIIFAPFVDKVSELLGSGPVHQCRFDQ